MQDPAKPSSINAARMAPSQDSLAQSRNPERHRMVRGGARVVWAFLIGAAGCGDTVAPVAETPSYCNARSGADIVEFSEPNFEYYITRMLGSPLTCERALLVTELDLARQRVFDPPLLTLEGIQNFPNLRTLYLTLEVELDLSPVSALSDLETVSIGTVGGKLPLDVGPLGLLRRLEHLEIHNTVIDDVSPLGEIASLRVLNLDGNHIEDAAPLSRLEGLFTLSLRGNAIADVSSLRGMGELKQLWLSRNQIAEIPPLIGSSELESLELDANRIVDIASLSGLSKLVDLQLGRNSIQDVSPLAGLTAMRYLLLGDNRIGDVTPLSQMTAVEVLTLSRNALTDITGLDQLVSLRFLRLTGNTELTVIDPLLANAGIGPGDGVWLDSTSVSCQDIARLREKGTSVIVYKSC